MKRPTKFVLFGLAAIVILAAAWLVVQHLAGQTPPHLAKRLPAPDAMPPGLYPDQQAAIRLLYSSNPSDRLRGIRAMFQANMAEEVQVPYLVALLADDPTLQQQSEPLPVETWFRGLMGYRWKEADVSFESFSTLQSMSPAAAPAVLKALKAEEDATLRRHLVSVLGYMAQYDLPEAGAGPPPLWQPDPAALDALVDALRDEADADVRAAALDGFLEAVEIGRFHGGARRLAALDDDTGLLPNRATALDPRHREALLAAAHQDPAINNRLAALGGIARHLGPEAVPHLVQAMDDPQDVVREQAAWLLASPGFEPEREAVFLPRSRDSHPARPQVVQALLAAMEREASQPSLRSPAIRAALAKALHQLTGQDLGDDAGKWLEWRDEHKAEFAPTP